MLVLRHCRRTLPSFALVARLGEWRRENADEGRRLAGCRARSGDRVTLERRIGATGAKGARRLRERPPYGAARTGERRPPLRSMPPRRAEENCAARTFPPGLGCMYERPARFLCETSRIRR